jgi:uncharacterized RDD family membrane protein YckC
MDEESTTGAPASLLRRLSALTYDLLLVAALLLVVGFAMLPLSRGEAVTTATQGTLGLAYHAVLALVAFIYFGWSWTRGGQTLGMRAWRIVLERRDGRVLGWPAAAARYLLGSAMAYLAVFGCWHLAQSDRWLETAGAAALIAPLACNFAWVPFDRERRSLMDLAGNARMRRLPNP